MSDCCHSRLPATNERKKIKIKNKKEEEIRVADQ